MPFELQNKKKTGILSIFKNEIRLLSPTLSRDAKLCKKSLELTFTRYTVFGIAKIHVVSAWNVTPNLSLLKHEEALHQNVVREDNVFKKKKKGRRTHPASICTISSWCCYRANLSSLVVKRWLPLDLLFLLSSSASSFFIYVH